jgi:anti-anti-sigma factor
MMSHAPTEPASSHAHIAFELNDDKNPRVVIVEFLSRAIADPGHAAELSSQLCTLIRPELPKRFVLDFEDVRSLSSTAFGALVSFVLKVRQAGGQVAICNMDEFVRFGADVIRLGDYAEFADDRHVAIAAFLEDSPDPEPNPYRSQATP